jgi:hypothetical protein
MKNLFKTTANLLLATLFALSFSSCEKEEITPDNVTSTTEVKANDDAVTTQYNNATTISVLGNDTGIDISISSIISDPLDGTVSISGNNIVYTPNNGYSGNDSFTYEISDLTGVTSIAVVTVTVLPNNVIITNNPPNVSGAIQIDHEGVYVEYSQFITDTDGDNISIVSITGAVNGSVNYNTNSLTYVPTNTIYAGVENLVITVSDGYDTISANVELTYGFPGQIATYNLIEQYLGTQFSVSSHVPALKFNADGTVTSNQDPSFWNTSQSWGTYTITSTGKFRLNPGGMGNYIDYTVTEFNAYGEVGLTFSVSGKSDQPVWID